MKGLHLLLPVLAAASLAASSQANVSFQITKLYTCHEVNGVIEPYTPMVGEPYKLCMEYDVVGGPAKNEYTIRFHLGEETHDYKIKFLNGHALFASDFQPPLDGPIPIGAEIDPTHTADGPTGNMPPKNPSPQTPRINRPGTYTGLKVNPALLNQLGGPTYWTTFTPRPPSKSIDTFDPKFVMATQSAFFDINNKATSLHMMLGAPETGTWMKIIDDTCKVSSKLGDHFLIPQPVANPTFAPVYYVVLSNVPAGKVSVLRQTRMELSNMRVDADALRKVTWAQMDAAQGINAFHFYTHPSDTPMTIKGATSEGVIEEKSPVIADFVNKALGGPNYRSKYTPYDAARKVFMAVIGHVKYTYPSNGAPDLRPKDAVGVIEKGLGDCGGYSLALVACFRHMGIPARTSYGAWIGQDAGHCWAELYFPQHGWILADGSAGNSMSPDGKLAYYFGNSNNQNARYACARLNTFNLGNYFTNWLQGPSWPDVVGAQVNNWDAHTFLMDIPAPPAGGYKGPTPHIVTPPMHMMVTRPRDAKDPYLHSIPDAVFVR